MTKGKWEVAEITSGAEAHKTFKIKSNNQLVAKVTYSTLWGGEISPEEAKGNAQLIALAGNLAQEYDLSQVQELVKTIKKTIGELAQFGQTISNETFEELKVNYHKLIAPGLEKARK